jgi:hypothetical protein
LFAREPHDFIDIAIAVIVINYKILIVCHGTPDAIYFKGIGGFNHRVIAGELPHHVFVCRGDILLILFGVSYYPFAFNAFLSAPDGNKGALIVFFAGRYGEQCEKKDGDYFVHGMQNCVIWLD